MKILKAAFVVVFGASFGPGAFATESCDQQRALIESRAKQDVDELTKKYEEVMTIGKPDLDAVKALVDQCYAKNNELIELKSASSSPKTNALFAELQGLENQVQKGMEDWMVKNYAALQKKAKEFKDGGVYELAFFPTNVAVQRSYPVPGADHFMEFNYLQVDNNPWDSRKPHFNFALNQRTDFSALAEGTLDAYKAYQMDPSCNADFWKAQLDHSEERNEGESAILVKFRKDIYQNHLRAARYLRVHGPWITNDPPQYVNSMGGFDHSAVDAAQ